MDIVEVAKNTIPSPMEILEEAIANLGIQDMGIERILENFEALVSKIEETAFRIYSSYENKAFNKLLSLWMEENKNTITGILESKERVESKREKLTNLLLELVPLIREMEFKAGQMRKSRGGAAFEEIIALLLKQVGIPVEKPSKKTKKLMKRIDYVSPDAETAEKTPDKAIFLAMKRTLRERWKQVVPEQMKGARLYLVTLDEKMSEEKANEIQETGMIVYVPSKVKELPHLKDKPWVRKLSELPGDIRNSVPKPPSKQLRFF